jgi:hypothetical protein
VALTNQDVKTTAIRRTWVRDSKGENVPGYEIHFTIRGMGDYTASLPIQGFSAVKAMESIAAVASPIVDLLDMTKGS